MKILSDSDQDIKKAAEAISAGLLVAFPTETVYGLGADAFNLSSLAKVFEVKNRPRFDPLIIHIAELNALSRIADLSVLDKTAKEKLSLLSEKLWPGPLTIILPKRDDVPDLATAALPTVAVRFPSHIIAQKLIRLSTGAVAAPSANSFGSLSPTRAEHVIAQLGAKVDFVIYGGKTQVGLESTVLDLSGLNLSDGMPSILRHGGTSKEAIEALIGPVENAAASSPETPHSPGQLKSHYAPGTPLVIYGQGELSSVPNNPNEGRLYFSLPGKGISVLSERTKILSESGNLNEAAANFFDMLHDLDKLGLNVIRAEEAPATGLGEAINDRLRRAAAK